MAPSFAQDLASGTCLSQKLTGLISQRCSYKMHQTKTVGQTGQGRPIMAKRSA